MCTSLRVFGARCWQLQLVRLLILRLISLPRPRSLPGLCLRFTFFRTGDDDGGLSLGLAASCKCQRRDRKLDVAISPSSVHTDKIRRRQRKHLKVSALIGCGESERHFADTIPQPCMQSKCVSASSARPQSRPSSRGR